MSDYAAPIRPAQLRAKGSGVCSLPRRQVGKGGGMGMDKERASEAAALENHPVRR